MSLIKEVDEGTQTFGGKSQNNKPSDAFADLVEAQ